MKTLTFLTRHQNATADASERRGVLETHAVWRDMGAGTVRAVHCLADGPRAALELGTGTAEEARACIGAALPFVAANLVHAQTSPLMPLPPFAALA